MVAFPHLQAVTTFFGGTRWACASDHSLTNAVEMMMNPDTCPSAFKPVPPYPAGLEMMVSGLTHEVGELALWVLAHSLSMPLLPAPPLAPPYRPPALPLCLAWTRCGTARALSCRS